MRNPGMKVGVVVAGCAGLVFTMSPGWATGLTIANPGFESPSLTAGQYTTGNGVPGWSIAPNSPSSGSFNTGVFNPLTWMQPGAWVGAQMGYSNGGILEQTVASQVLEGHQYTLTYRIIHRPGYIPTGRVQLQGGATVLGEIIETATNRPPSGSFALRTLRVTVPGGSLAIGHNVRIVINTVGAAQTDFDDFKLDLVTDGNACPADFNGDGFVDDSDFVIFAQRYDEFITQPDGLCDFNADGFVDDFDFTLFAAAYVDFVCP